MPIHYAAYEWRNQVHPGLRARAGLGQAEDQRQIALDTLTLQFSCRADAFLGCRQFYQDTVA